MLIKSTPKLLALLKNADLVQNASNPLAVTNFLADVMRYWHKSFEDGQEAQGSDIAANNPISITVISKLQDMAGLPWHDDEVAEAFDACEMLGIGQDVEWSLKK